LTARRGVLVASGAACLAVAVLLALLASDVLAWKRTFQQVDAAYLAREPSPQWRIDAVFPFATARAMLGVGADVAYRQALLLYRGGEQIGPSFDNGVSRRQAQAAAEISLAHVEQTDPDPVRASRAANLLGILAMSGPPPIAPGQPDPVDRALAEFRNAIGLDPRNGDAKYNLELLLRQLVATGTRPGASAGQSGRSSGRHGAGVSPPGRGY
jgi:hypothetical protein